MEELPDRQSNDMPLPVSPSLIKRNGHAASLAEKPVRSHADATEQDIPETVDICTALEKAANYSPAENWWDDCM